MASPCVMYGFYKQLHPPTGIEIARYCHFFNMEEKNLVICAVNTMSIYRLNSDVEAKDKGQDMSHRRDKLECMMTFNLFGSVACIESVHLPGMQRDAILVAFRQGKLSLLEYDPAVHDLKTLSLHYFEDEAMKDGHTQNDHHNPMLQVDPEGRCAALLIYGSRLVVLPFRRENTAGDIDPDAGSKSYVLSSYVIDLKKTDERIRPVLDMQFLHGYYEPTLLILYEPLPTWCGRVAVRRDSCSIAAISLNMLEKVHPVIWSQDNLPYDCAKTFAVPKPIGGVMVFATNSLIYLNQSFPPYGVSLNSITDVSTEFILKPQPLVKILLDNANAAFITEDKMVISLQGGEIYILTLIADSMRAIRSFHLDKSAASVLTTCVCACDNGYLFLGSRLGNSVLLKYTEKNSDSTADQPTPAITNGKKGANGEPAAKKQKKDNITDWMASDISQLDDLDELEVYGDQPNQQIDSKICQFTFEVCDSLMNIGPCGQCMMGEPAFLSEEFTTDVDPDIELVTTSGYGKNGAITVLQRSIRPQVVTTFELGGCTDMWTVRDPLNEDEASRPGHAFLIINRDDSTMVLRTGQEIMELDQSGFYTTGRTVFASNIGDYIIQVCTNAVILLQGAEEIQYMSMDVGSPLVACSVVEPYMLLLSQKGHLSLLTLTHDMKGKARLEVTTPNIAQEKGSQVITICGYLDKSGMFMTHADREETEASAPAEPTHAAAPVKEETSNLDDEDELLYGESDISTLFAAPKVEPEPIAAPQPEPKRKRKEIKLTYWAIVARANNLLEFYTVPDFKLMYVIKNFSDGGRLLMDSGEQQTANKKESSASADEPSIKEVLMVGLGNKQSRPHLMARIDETVILYEAFVYSCPTANQERLQLRFKKIPHGLILRQRKGRGMRVTYNSPWFRPFLDISGYSGVFICAPYPHWMMMGVRGILRYHPMNIDGSIHCFAAFHNVNCPKGFLYFNSQGELRISVMPTHLSYDSSPWPVRKVPLRCTPHSACYHLDSKTYSVVTSTPEPCSKFVKVIGDGEKEFETHERDDRFIHPPVHKFVIQLFSPVSWESIPNTKIELDEFEHVTCIRCVSLKSEGTLSGLKQFVAVSTSYAYNEDVTARGRMIIYDVIEVVPEPGQPLTKNKIKIEYDKEQKGPVTCLDCVMGFLVTAIGQKIYVWQLVAGDLQGVAFIDTQVYVHQLATLKNLVMVADMCKSVSLLRFQEDLKVLSLVSRDFKPMDVFSSAFFVDNQKVGFLVADRLKNITIYTYEPQLKESYGGQKMLNRADINVDHQINTFWRVRCKLVDPSLSQPLGGTLRHTHITYFASLDGNIGYVVPIDDKMIRRLNMLQNALYSFLPHTAALNPKGYRFVRHENRSLSNTQRNIIDGELVWLFMNLSHNEQIELSRRIGADRNEILDAFLDIDRSTAHF